MSFASFLSSILTSRDNPALVTHALQLAELLLVKLPAIYTRSFQREGVFYEIDKLAKEELSPSARSKRKEAAQKSGADTKPDAESASQSGATDAEKTDGTPKGASRGADATASRLLQALAGEEATPVSAFERALGAARAKPGTSSAARRVSSVPSNPHDANIVRARILQIKRWGLSDKGRSAPSSSSGVSEVIQLLSDAEITDGDLQQAFKKIADLLTDKVEPLSSFEMLQSGLLAKLMGMLEEGEKAAAHRNILFEALAETSGDSELSPLALLVKRLQDSLSRLDNFEVETTNGGVEADPKRTLPSLLRTMTVQLSADSDSPLPISWKSKAIEIALPCVAPISSMNSFLRSSTRISGLGGASALKTDLDALLDSGPAVGAAGSATKQPDDADTKPTTRRSARLRGETVQESESAAADTEMAAPEEKAEAKQPEHAAAEDDFDDDRSTQNGEDAHDVHGDEALHGHMMGEDLLMDDEDDDDEMDDEMEGEGIFLEDHLDDDDPEQDDETGGDQLQEKPVDLEVPSDGSKPQGITPHGTRVATPTPEASAADTSRVAGVPPRTRSYAAALKAPTTDFHYRFSHNGQDLGYQESLYGALSRVKRMSGTVVRLSFYERQVLKVRKVEGPAPLPGESPILRHRKL